MGPLEQWNERVREDRVGRNKVVTVVGLQQMYIIDLSPEVETDPERK